ncbi:MAG: lytic transglycosylase domain-containing protein [Candidatus Eisenbacteria bacterium]
MHGAEAIGGAKFFPLSGRAEGTGAAGGGEASVRAKKLGKAASDFEALLLTHILKSMRSSAEMFGDDEEETGSGMMSEFADEQLAVAIARGGGLGLARMLRERLLPEGGPGAAAVSHEGVPPRTSVPSRSSPAGAAGGVEGIVARAAKRFDLDPDLLRAVIAEESAGRPGAVSPKGAKGLMQLMDGTAREMGVRDPFDPEQNVFGGARYLRSLLDRFGGDLELAVASYNAGPAAVERHGGVPPYPETERYVEGVIGRLEKEGERGPRDRVDG